MALDIDTLKMGRKRLDQVLSRTKGKGRRGRRINGETYSSDLAQGRGWT